MMCLAIGHKRRRFIPAGIWYAIIFCSSAQTGHHSSALSDRLACRLLELFPPSETDYAEVMKTVTFCIRKSAHMAAYFILAALLMWAVRECLRSPGHSSAAVVFLCAVLAGLDEFHQTFVPGRSGQFRDILIDLVGTGGFLLLWLLIHCVEKRMCRRKTIQKGMC